MSKSNRVELLKVSYKRVLTQCEGYEDDRKLFISCYNQLMDAVLEFEILDIKNPIIHVAFNEKFKKEREQLDKQAKGLLERGMINKI